MDITITGKHATPALGRCTLLHLPAGLDLRFLSVTDSYWEHRFEHGELVDGRIMSVFDYTKSSTWWERHPDGDEFVHVITGEVDFLLDNGREQHLAHLSPGDGTIVPRGTWHSAVIDVPTTMLFITPSPPERSTATPPDRTGRSPAPRMCSCLREAANRMRPWLRR